MLTQVKLLHTEPFEDALFDDFQTPVEEVDVVLNEIKEKIKDTGLKEHMQYFIDNADHEEKVLFLNSKHVVLPSPPVLDGETCEPVCESVCRMACRRIPGGNGNDEEDCKEICHQVCKCIPGHV